MYAEQETNVLVKPHSRAGIKIFDGQKSDFFSPMKWSCRYSKNVAKQATIICIVMKTRRICIDGTFSHAVTRGDLAFQTASWRIFNWLIFLKLRAPRLL